MQILTLQPQDTYLLRQTIPYLKGIQSPLEYPEDYDENTFHLGVVIEKKLITVASFYFNQHPDIDAPYQYQMRGLVTRADSYRKGYAKSILDSARSIIIKNQGTTLWCYISPELHRVSALLALGFFPIGSIQNVTDLGVLTPKQLLYKKLLEN